MATTHDAVLGMDFGGTNLKAILFNSKGEIVDTYFRTSDVMQGPDQSIDKMINLVRAAAKASKEKNLHLKTIGLGVCSPVNYAKGEIIQSSILPGWNNIPVATMISDEIGLPVHLENDTNAALLGEWWQGRGKHAKVIAGLSLGTGIGGGLIINGRVFQGGMGHGGEFGHIRVADGPECPCGGSGCLGRVASATATLNRYRELSGRNGVAVDDLMQLGKLAASGDINAQNAIAKSADYLGQAILAIANCLNPNIFLLTGGMAGLGDLLLDPIKQHLISAAYRTDKNQCELASGTLGMYSGCYGSAYLALSDKKPLPE
ncbi:MAG: ROK family protein [Desulfobacteraceae bacterium]